MTDPAVDAAQRACAGTGLKLRLPSESQVAAAREALRQRLSRLFTPPMSWSDENVHDYSNQDYNKFAKDHTLQARALAYQATVASNDVAVHYLSQAIMQLADAVEKLTRKVENGCESKG